MASHEGLRVKVDRCFWIYDVLQTVYWQRRYDFGQKELKTIFQRFNN